MTEKELADIRTRTEWYEKNIVDEGLLVCHDRRVLLAEVDRLRAENERLKTVPMKYRRMEFNAKLQAELDAEREKVRVLRAENERLRRALLDLMVSLIPMPPYETGKAAQDAWSNNRLNAEERARAALEEKP